MVGIDSPCNFITIEGIKTAYYRSKKNELEATNNKPSVLLLHGGSPGACSNINWFLNFGYLSDQGYDVIAYDQPGFGHSTTPDDHSIEFRYQHAVEFIRALDLSSVHLIGNSIGGLLSTLIVLRAQKHGIRVRSLVLAAPYPYFPVPDTTQKKLDEHRQRLGSIEQTFDSVKNLCLNTFNNASKLTDGIVNLRLSMLQGSNWDNYKARSAQGRRFNSEPTKDSKIHLPTLMVWGLNDNSLPHEIGVSAMSYFDNAQFLFLPSCGHWPQTEQHTPFNLSADQFLRSVDGVSARLQKLAIN